MPVLWEFGGWLEGILMTSVCRIGKIESVVAEIALDKVKVGSEGS
jgi:hypothetical protein